MCFLCLIRPKTALLSYVNSDISKKSSLFTISWKTNHEKNNYNNINNKKSLSNIRKSSSSIIKDSKINKKNQMKVLDDGNVKRASAPQDAEGNMIHGHVYQTKCSWQDTETLLPKDIYGISQL